MKESDFTRRLRCRRQICWRHY